ncbi:MAG: TolC family outer membrane protein [Arenicella sp.]
MNGRLGMKTRLIKSGLTRLSAKSLSSVVALMMMSHSAAAIDILEAYDLALKNDKSYSVVGRDVESSKLRQKQAKRLYFPELSLNYDRIETDQNIVSSENTVFGQGESSFPTDDYGLTLTQPIFRWDLIVERRRAKDVVTAAEYDLAAEQQALILRTAEAYLRVLSAQDNLSLSQNEAKVLAKTLEESEKRFEVGIADATELYESSARFEFTKAEVVNAEIALSDSKEALSIIIGKDLPTFKTLTTAEYPLLAPEPVDMQPWIEEAYDNNLRLKASKADIKVAAQEVKRIKSTRYPTLNLVVESGTRKTGGSLFGGASEVDTTDAILRLNIPIIQRGQTGPQIREAILQRQKAEDITENLKRTIKRSTKASYYGITGGISRINALKASVISQEKNLEAKQKGFESGRNARIEVLDAQRDLYLASRDLSGAYYQYIANQLRLKEQTARLSKADLAYINEYLQDVTVEK